MAKDKKRKKIFETRYFGLIIGVLVAGLFLFISQSTTIIRNMDTKFLDGMFRLREFVSNVRIQEGVTISQNNPNINPDILIVGIDNRALSEYGRWPFDRSLHGTLLDNFTRITDQTQRERAIFLDVFFIDTSAPEQDALLVSAIQENDRVFLETVLDLSATRSSVMGELFDRHQTLYESYGRITNLSGSWQDMTPFYGLQPPLQPYGRVSAGFGHANFLEDDDKIYRRQPLVAKSAEFIEDFPLTELTIDTPVDVQNYERLVWIDRNNAPHNVPYPLTPAVIEQVNREIAEADAPREDIDANGDGIVEESIVLIRRYRDYFIPSITLALACEYFHKELSDIDVRVGESIRIPNPESYNADVGLWMPYSILETPAQIDDTGAVVREEVRRRINELIIPIDTNGAMIVNFMGPPSGTQPDEAQTFPVRSYYGYSNRPVGDDPSEWRPTNGTPNSIVMLGAFARGMAADEKPTPFGLMYGIEVHANSLNTILMEKFLIDVPYWIDVVVLFLVSLLTAFFASRIQTLWSLLISLLMIVGLFIGVYFAFESSAILVDLAAPGLSIFFSFLAVVLYRVMTEEKDKRRIKDMFSKYVSPAVVDQLMEKPPELGGVDKELSVLFSDIRGFTTLSESMTPQELVNHLNLYLTAMTDTIIAYLGTLDKYVGDEIMCFWGAPLPQEDHALLTCKCALKQMQVLAELNAGWPPEKRIDIGIGVNSGIMTVGNMGSPGRLNYTLMGDNVNLGARLEGTNKQYATHVIISEYTYGLVKDKVIARELDNIRVKGKNKPVMIYELIDIIEGLEPPLPVDAKRRSR